MVPGALHEHRGDVTLDFEQQTCINILVVTARAGSDVVVGSRKLCWDDVWLSRVVPAIEKFDESRVLGPAPFKEPAGDMQYWYYKEFMEWLTDLLTKKVTVSTVNRKLKELRQLQEIYTNVYHPNLPIHDPQRMSCMFCGQSAVLYTDVTAYSRTEFQVFFLIISM